MARVSVARGPHERIVVGLPDIQDQIRMVHRLCSSAEEPELERWHTLGNLLYELYTQLQHQRQVTIYRYANKSSSGPKSGKRR